MKFENIEDAKKELVKSVLAEYEATINGDDKLQEKNILRAFKINDYIKNNFDLKDLKDLLDYNHPKVQIWTAKLLLPIYEDIALKVLDDISKKGVAHCSSNARIMYCEWTKQPITFL
ncbi:hypothetical protein [Aquimarina pacifica]|uniref:hypothetical protein n=1 Tax=Aquimarina pacifica TaxID=1296415 RepID=UPI000470EFAB|nr:hypothetical protein [Aquimarina pacifica]